MQTSTPLINRSVTLTTLYALLQAYPQLEENILLIIVALGISYQANPSAQAAAMQAISVLEQVIPTDSEAHRQFEMQLKRTLTALQVNQQPTQADALRNLYRHSRLANHSELQI
ncbi:hypothetical protein RO21_11190 [[Actinobacillus] muris]|uniref:Uncharacterized protein n=1 Tax=Muribacter muris TaxID=67855 RepID=A0A0J5P4Z9_9PAST|nr:hypothetical protein [Muribacter muris]KMK50544.1 hypothetical protein RO21_11190 [[Actinobacillus] muris] [Muribacter muris]